MEKAAADLDMAHRAMQGQPLPDMACLHAQQCAEKAL
jgi:HEPN domain-containing protein